MATVSNWMHVDYFSVDQASALWCEIDPAKVSIIKQQNPPELMAVKQLLIGGIVSGARPSNGQLIALCAVCATLMHKRISLATLEALKGILQIAVKQAGDTIGKGEQACLNDT